MCDTVAGQLIIGFASGDPAGKALIEQLREGLIEHVSYLADM